MKSSESIKQLTEAFNKAQTEMSGAEKGSKNPFFKSNYADLNSVIEAVKGPLNNHGLSFMQHPISSERCIGVCTRITHSSGEWIEESVLFPLTKADPQAAGSLITYARRYALQAMCGIPAVDDDGNLASGRNENNRM